jgi:soluble lytic murein transglycosylase-like protein
LKLFLLLVLACAASAAEYVVLNTGFTIRAQRLEAAGDIVRVTTEAGVIEVSRRDVAALEVEDDIPPPAPEVQSTPARVKEPVDPAKLVTRAAERHGLPPELLHSVAAVESGYSQDALSPKGAIGIMQLMPGTAALLNADPNDPEQNVDAGARHLRDLLVKYDGGLYRALAAYNAGAGAVDRYNGIPPYRETQLYVDRVFQRYKKLNQKQ